MVVLKPQNFAIPSNIIKIFELVSSLLAVTLIISWNSKGVIYSDLNKADPAIVRSINFFIAISAISLVFVIPLCILIVTDQKYLLAPLLDGLMSLTCCLLWLICSILLSVKLASIADSITVREMDLKFTGLEIAISFGFLSMAFHGGDIWFAVVNRRRKDDSPIRHTRMSAHLYSDASV